MPDWLLAVLGGVLGLLLIGGVFWFAFRRIPEQHDQSPMISFDATQGSSGDADGHSL